MIEVKITCTSPFHTNTLSNALYEFREKHPGIIEKDLWYFGGNREDHNFATFGVLVKDAKALTMLTLLWHGTIESPY